MDRLMTSYLKKKESADPHFPFGHASAEPAKQFLVNTGTYRAGSCAHRDGMIRLSGNSQSAASLAS
jgi:hypothetical protein